MSDIPLIYDDPRPINAIWYADGKEGYQLGTGTVAKIIAYREHGVSDFVPYYAVYGFSDGIIARVPAHMVTVVYGKAMP